MSPFQALQLRRLLTICAHNKRQLFNSSKLGESLGVTYQTVRWYIDLMEQTFIRNNRRFNLSE